MRSFIDSLFDTGCDSSVVVVDMGVLSSYICVVFK